MAKPQLISSILKPLLKRYGLETQMQIYTLIDQWENLVGYQVATHTLPYQLKFKKLYLYVDSPAWMNQLSYLKEELKKKINKEVGEIWVKEIIMNIGPVEKKKEMPLEESVPAIQKKEKVSLEEMVFIEKSLETLKENGLKKELKKFLIQAALHSKER